MKTIVFSVNMILFKKKYNFKLHPSFDPNLKEVNSLEIDRSYIQTEKAKRYRDAFDVQRHLLANSRTNVV